MVSLTPSPVRGSGPGAPGSLVEAVHCGVRPPAPAVPPDCLLHPCPLVAVPAVPHRAACPPMALCHLPVVAPRYVLLLHGDASIRRFLASGLPLYARRRRCFGGEIGETPWGDWGDRR